MLDDGPTVNQLSAAQLRLLARVKSVRPRAQLHWLPDGAGWALEVHELARDHSSRCLLTARFRRDGTINSSGAVL
jgi:hypothetical protein